MTIFITIKKFLKELREFQFAQMRWISLKKTYSETMKIGGSEKYPIIYELPKGTLDIFFFNVHNHHFIFLIF